jgi:hypothetical protein
MKFSLKIIEIERKLLKEISSKTHKLISMNKRRSGNAAGIMQVCKYVNILLFCSLIYLLFNFLLGCLVIFFSIVILVKLVYLFFVTFDTFLFCKRN